MIYLYGSTIYRFTALYQQYQPSYFLIHVTISVDVYSIKVLTTRDPDSTAFISNPREICCS